MRIFILFFLVISTVYAQVHVRGSEVAYPLVAEIAKKFNEDNKDLTILVSSTSSNHGFFSVREGQSDIAMSCRPVKTAEVLKFEEKKMRLVEIPVAF
ncbi:MAG: substrate-binding domain-containing protein, partial [Cytophagales bacterium]